MKIVGFTQHRNELSKGNLQNWLRCMDVCDRIYIYDQASDDGSLDVLRSNSKCALIESRTNDFQRENFCKKILLDKLLRENPDAEWILWMDCDYLLNNDAIKDNFAHLRAVLKNAADEGIDGVVFNHYNLWRSDVYYRTDDSYHSLNDEGRVSVWRNNGRLRYNPQPGLHKSPLPEGISATKRVDIDLLHRGFATDYQILTKYSVYRSFGQSGWALDRLISENGLTVERLPDGKLPDWYLPFADTEDPRNKPPLISKHKP